MIDVDSSLTVTAECVSVIFFVVSFFFQAEDGIRDLVRSRGLGDVYKRQLYEASGAALQTVAYSTNAFTPTACAQWVAHDIDILSLIHI